MAELSTFSKTQTHLETTQTQPASIDNTQATTDTPVVAAQPDSQPAVAADNNNSTQTDVPVVTELSQQPDNSSSDFDIDFGDSSQSQQRQSNDNQPAQNQPVFNLDEELKKVDKKEILKKLGVSDFAIEIDQHINGGGQPADYLNARAIDYNKVSDENIIKNNLKKHFPDGTSDDQINIYFNKKYGFSEDASDDDKIFAALQLKSDAHNLRQQLISEQQKFKIPETPIPQKDEAYEQWKVSNIESQQRMEAISNYYLQHEATKALNESKRVAINLGEGVAPFNFVINKPELITKAFTDGGETWKKLTQTPQGEPDVAKQQLIALFSFNPSKFVQDIFNYGKSMGVRKEIIEEGQNAQRKQAVVHDMTQSNKMVVTGVGKYGDQAR